MDDCHENRKGFLSLPRELRDQIYRHWWRDEERTHRNDDEGIWIPFEDPEMPVQPIRIKRMRTNKTIPKHAWPGLLLSHQIRNELLTSAFHKLSLSLTIQHLTINELCLAPWSSQQWTIPPTTLAHARSLDLRIDLIPRYSFAQRHTLESQMKMLREHGYNVYMGEPRNAQHRLHMSNRAYGTIGKRHVELRTPAEAFARFETAMEGVTAMVARKGLAMPDSDRDEFNSSRHLQRYLFWEIMVAGKGSAIVERFWERVEAIKRCWHVDLPWCDYLMWIKDDVWRRDEEIANMLDVVLWEDFVAGMRRLAEQVRELVQEAKMLKTLRLHLRMEDEAIAGMEKALKMILDDCPVFGELKGLESISLFSKADMFSGEYATHVEQWTSLKGLRASAGLRKAIEDAGFEGPVNVKIGRQELVSGRDILFASSQWANQAERRSIRVRRRLRVTPDRNFRGRIRANQQVHGAGWIPKSV